jgi:hypothetical protein
MLSQGYWFLQYFESNNLYNIIRQLHNMLKYLEQLEQFFHL